MFLMVVFMLNILSGCSSSQDTASHTDVNPENKTLSNKNTSNKTLSNQSQGFSNNIDKITTQLVINHRCIACGRCSLFDPGHFNSRGRRSVPDVVSQDNLNSPQLKKAIQACPVDAIELS